MAKVYGAFERNVTQLGREATAGTLVAADTIWRGPFVMLEDTEEQKAIDEQIGNLFGEEAVYSTMYGGRLAMAETPMSFDQITHVFDAGWMDATPVGAQAPYVRTYTDVPGTPQTVRTYTIETGNLDASADNQRMGYAFVEEWQLSASAGSEWLMSATWIGRQVAANALTASLDVPAVQVAVLPMTKLYINATGGTVGSTQVAGVLMGATIRRTTGWRIVPVGDGTRLYAAIKQVRPEATFSLTVELEQDTGVSLVATERAIWRAKTARLFRLEIDGDNANHELKIDWCGRYSAVGAYENADGNTTVTLEGRMTYNATDELYMEAVLTNTLAELD
jgi:hypothetical protein